MSESNIRLLIVEDTSSDVDLIIHRLKKDGVDISYEVVEQLPQVLNKLQNNVYEMVISDFNLGGFDGIDVLKVVKQHNQLLPFIMLSGVMTHEQETKVLELGGDEVLLKTQLNRLPFSVRRLLHERKSKDKLQEVHKKLKKERTRINQSQKLAGMFWWGYDPENDNVEWSDAAYHLLKVNKEQFGETMEAFMKLVHPQDRPSLKKTLRVIRKEKKPQIYSLRIKSKGEITHFKCSADPEVNENGVITYIYGTAQDITQLKRHEQRLEQALKHQQELLSEVHHRVKNNLAIISSFLELRLFETTDQTERELLTKLIGKIKSIGLVHEHLYHSMDFLEVELGALIEDLADMFQMLTSPHDQEINIQCQTDPVLLNVNQAVPCSLILSELLVNAAEHAFDGQDDKRITIISQPTNSNTIELTVSDNGVGLPEGFAFEQEAGLGSTIISTQLKQLNADYIVKTDKGSTITFTFELNQGKGAHSNWN
ncbi:response regulator [Aliifodinibius sp. S!AR15-10]|uniref:histidine kinase dimerization/phosphoacceptor domain -containing protein n=1 Tax=Aliifodinibius sp. S!AR15-10 TaxID=2950437 RepID=UPI0028667A6A|nr:histidine kinase dimerization/phosphoacceptor domain -containing protein [Aliifodinibius sp. S!AR15-10]MDR8390436.1 response regulator [Aliifodinibius sp. S!AR15-10]